MSPLGGAPAGTVVACDVGGTGIKAGLVDTAGRVRHARTVPTPIVDGDGDATAKAVLDRVAELVAHLAARGVPAGSGAPAGIGVIVPGLVDAAAGMARYSENLGWRDVPFAARLAEATGPSRRNRVRRGPERSAPAAGGRLPRSPPPGPGPGTCGSPPGPAGRAGHPGPSR